MEPKEETHQETEKEDNKRKTNRLDGKKKKSCWINLFSPIVLKYSLLDKS